MAKFVLTVKQGNNGASVAWRDVETGVVGAMEVLGPTEQVQSFLKRVIEPSPEVEVKYE